jgi:hypothetical protein
LFRSAELRVDVELVLAERLQLEPAVEEGDELHGGLLLEGEDAAPGEVEGDFLEEGGDEGVEVLDVVLGGRRLLGLQHLQVEHQHQAHQHLQIFELALRKLVFGEVQELEDCGWQLHFEVAAPQHPPQVLPLSCPHPLVALVGFDQRLQAGGAEVVARAERREEGLELAQQLGRQAGVRGGFVAVGLRRHRVVVLDDGEVGSGDGRDEIAAHP